MNIAMSMTNRTRATLLASALIMGSSMVGCSGAGIDHRPAMSAAQARTSATRIEAALASKDFARALLAAEALVATSPRDADYRALLGRTYLANGRYLSARVAFADAMTLGKRDPRTIVSMALVETGIGGAARARALLADNIGNLPAADYGLAMTIAGDPKEGVRALLEAVKMDDATARTRQNLAYAFALSGDWAQAQIVGAQDMDGATLRGRLLQWSQTTRDGAEPLRVAALLGVPPRFDDAGLPVRLALKDVPEPNVRQANAASLIEQAEADVKQQGLPRVTPAQLAAVLPVLPIAQVVPSQLAVAVQAPPVAESAPVNPAVSAGSQAVKIAEPVPPQFLAAAFEGATRESTPVVRAQTEPMREAVKMAFARKERAKLDAVPDKPVASGRDSEWVVQLGAFDSRQIAAEKWQRIRKARPKLSGYTVANSMIDLKGRTFHRLAIMGFGDRAAAMSLCAAMRASGQNCFVRVDDRASAGMMARASVKSGKAPLRVARAHIPAKRQPVKQIASR